MNILDWIKPTEKAEQYAVNKLSDVAGKYGLNFPGAGSKPPAEQPKTQVIERIQAVPPKVWWIMGGSAAALVAIMVITRRKRRR